MQEKYFNMWSWNIGMQILLAVLIVKGISTVEGMSPTSSNEVIYEKYLEMDKYLKHIFNSAVRSLLPYAIEANENINLSSKCKANIFHLLADLRNLKLSAIKFLDAIAKPPEGILMGRITFLGDYEECLTTTFQNRNGDVAFRGQYCMVSIKSAMPSNPNSVSLVSGDKALKEATRNSSELMQLIASKVHALYNRSMKLGICIPTGCTEEDIKEMIGYLVRKINVDVDANIDQCNYEGKYPTFTMGKIVAITFLLFLGLLSVISTFVEYFCKGRNITVRSVGVRLLLCFSLLTNFPQLLDTKNVKKSEKQLLCLYGIRSLSCFYIILLHQYLHILFSFNVAHALKYLDEIQNFFFQVIPSATFTIEIFFIIGGLVNCYSRMKKNEILKNNLSMFQLIVLRIWRLYPGLIFIIFIAPKLFNSAYGPPRDDIQFVYSNCDSYWWQNILFISNFFEINRVCMGHTWYVCADMQLYVLTLFTIPVLIKKPTTGILLHIALIFAGLFSSSMWVWHKNIAPSLLLTHPSDEELYRFLNVYNSTLPHIAPYSAGILLGYVLHKKKELKLSKVVQLAGWLACILFFVSILFMSKRWNSGIEYTHVEAMLYFPISRLLYASAVGWLILCCATGHGGIINYVLSLSIWIPISRLSYMAYFVSFAVQGFFFLNTRVTIDNHRMVIIWQHLGDIMVTCLLCVVLVLVIESPFLAMQKMWFKKLTKEKPTRGNDNTVFVKETENSIISENCENGNIISTDKL